MWTVVVAGGAGRRFGAPKQFERLDHRRVVDVAVAVAATASAGVVVVLPSGDAVKEFVAEAPGGDGDDRRVVVGGDTRSDSVRAGLAAVPDAATIICVHDAARPLATSALFTRVVETVQEGADGAVPALPVTDTIKVVDLTGVVVDTPERDRLVAVQTPQAFVAPVLRAAHATTVDGTDDASLVERTGGRVVVVAGEPWNRKITDPDDLAWARTWLAGQPTTVDARR